MTSEECQAIIKENWCNNDQNPFERFIANGTKVLRELSLWGREKFGSLSKKIKAVKSKLKAIQCSPFHEARLEGELKRELDYLLEKEEMH